MERLYLAVFIAVMLTRPACADLIDIGQIFPTLHPGVSEGFGGIAFDGHADPVVIDRWTWTLSRVSTTDASVLSVQPVTPGNQGINGAYTEGLAYSSADSLFYTMAGSGNLATINPTTLRGTTRPNGGFFGQFLNLALDSTDGLWLHDNNRIYSVDKATGIVTPRSPTLIFGELGGRQITAMTIAPDNSFIISARSPYGQSETVYDLNPLTWSIAPITDTGDVGFTFLISMAYDPVSGRFFGVRQDRLGDRFSLVELTDMPSFGVPDLANSGLMLAGALVALFCLTRPRVWTPVVRPD